MTASAHRLLLALAILPMLALAGCLAEPGKQPLATPAPTPPPDDAESLPVPLSTPTVTPPTTVPTTTAPPAPSTFTPATATPRPAAPDGDCERTSGLLGLNIRLLHPLVMTCG